MLVKIIDSGYVDSVTLQYNMLDRSLEEGIAHAHEKGVGIVVMGPVGGGRLGADSQVLALLLPGVARVPELALRFVLSNPNVQENLAVASDSRSLTAEERQLIEDQLGRLRSAADLYCTACGYCAPCPNKVDIPAVFGVYNAARVYGLWDHAKARYKAMMKKGTVADLCVQCGECEARCPQHIPIRQQLVQSHEALYADPVNAKPAR
mgnify:CR=1 FL=1